MYSYVYLSENIRVPYMASILCNIGKMLSAGLELLEAVKENNNKVVILCFNKAPILRFVSSYYLLGMRSR